MVILFLNLMPVVHNSTTVPDALFLSSLKDQANQNLHNKEQVDEYDRTWKPWKRFSSVQSTLDHSVHTIEKQDL